MKFNRKQFFDGVRARLFGGAMSPGEVEGLNAILDYWENEFSPNTDLRRLAYILATVYHETDRTIQPIAEYGKGRGKRYAPYYGRGLVQLTWLKNYKTMGAVFGVDLVKNPNLALRMDLAVKILFYGMTNGTFGGKLSDYIHGKKCDYVGARRCVNVADKANLIAGYARVFEEILTNSSSAVPVAAENEDAEPNGALQQAAAGDSIPKNDLGNQAICKERPSTFTRWFVSIKATFGAIMAVIGTYFGAGDLKDVLANHSDTLLQPEIIAKIFVILLYLAITVLGGLFLMWLAAKIWDRATTKTNNLNMQKLIGAQDKTKQTTDFVG